MGFEVTKTISFSGAHRLRCYEGLCEAVHGHNWRIEATLAGDELDDTGMLIDFKVLKGILKEVVNRLDHTDLNAIEPFVEMNPTAENIARYIAEFVAGRLPKGIRVERITVWETDTSSASYIP